VEWSKVTLGTMSRDRSTWEKIRVYGPAIVRTDMLRKELLKKGGKNEKLA